MKQASGPRPTNVVVIACNAFHLGFLGTYGNAWIETPHLDRLASESVVFDYHFPENLTTLPTRRSWWTGRHGFADPDLGWTALRPDERILPDFLAAHGIRTALISDNPYLREVGHGFGRGFDDAIWIRGAGYDAFIAENDPRALGISIENEPGLPFDRLEDDEKTLWRGRWGQFLRNRAVLGFDRDSRNTSSARTVDAAIAWLERASTSAPFVLWIDLFAPHGPWDAPPEARDRYATVEPDEFERDDEGDLAEAGEEDAGSLEGTRVLIDVPPGVVGEILTERELLRLRRTYAGNVSHLDSQLGRLFEAVDQRGRHDDTLIIFTADQGEPLGEHGFVRRFRPWLYEELVHTPLILRLPKGHQGGTRHQALVQTVDLLPTILDAARVAPAGDLPLHGHSLLPLVNGEKTKLRDYACMGMDAVEFAIRTHNWHLVLPLEADPDDPDRWVELYRKPEDRWDQHNVVEQFPDVADQLELALRRFAQASLKDEIDRLPPLRAVARLGGAS